MKAGAGFGSAVGNGSSGPRGSVLFLSEAERLSRGVCSLPEGAVWWRRVVRALRGAIGGR